jgi:hypothetical protein
MCVCKIAAHLIVEVFVVFEELWVQQIPSSMQRRMHKVPPETHKPTDILPLVGANV